ncbi:hypothetical protein LTR74_017149 [Friedmanniomyces endolithicus]|nr:hypothetical protein LTR74_017149 [Friedmanniomyces endolithicus]
MARPAREERRRVAQSQSPLLLRRSARLREHTAANHQDWLQRRHLPSPSPSTPEKPLAQKKRRRGEPGEVEREHKRTRVNPEHHQQSDSLPRERVAHWVQTFTWPSSTMQNPAVALSVSTSTKRRSSSTHHSERQQRLEQNGIYMKTSALLQRASKQLCNDLLVGDRSPDQHPWYPVERTNEVLERLHVLNEARLQRDVTPWLVPSAEHLYFSGCAELGHVGEEIQAEWKRCEPMGVSRPKPDFVVGLQRSAFEDEELCKLENYATPPRPFLFTPNLSFPFLVCEAKTGQIGIDQADSQNIHSASVAVRAIFRLYSAAYGRDHEKTQGLLGRILVFSVSHNNRLVNLYGHYAVASNSKDGKDGTTEGLEYFRLTMHDGKDRYKAYNFIRNVYDEFALEHLRRIQDAVAQLPTPEKRTGLSFATSDLAVNDDGSQQDSELMSSQDDSGFKTPGEPASVSLRQENRKIRKQMDNLLLQLQEQRKESNKLLTQLEEQRKDSEQQRKESKEQLDRLLAMVTGSKRSES